MNIQFNPAQQSQTRTNYGKQQVGFSSLTIAKNICNREIIKEIPALQAAAKDVNIKIFADLNTGYKLPHYGDQVWVEVSEKVPFLQKFLCSPQVTEGYAKVSGLAKTVQQKKDSLLKEIADRKARMPEIKAKWADQEAIQNAKKKAIIADQEAIQNALKLS